MKEKKDGNNTFHSIAQFVTMIAWELIGENSKYVEAKEDGKGELMRTHRYCAGVLDNVLCMMGGESGNENAVVRCPHCKEFVSLNKPHEKVTVLKNTIS